MKKVTNWRSDRCKLDLAILVSLCLNGIHDLCTASFSLLNYSCNEWRVRGSEKSDLKDELNVPSILTTSKAIFLIKSPCFAIWSKISPFYKHQMQHIAWLNLIACCGSEGDNNVPFECTLAILYKPILPCLTTWVVNRMPFLMLVAWANGWNPKCEQ